MKKTILAFALTAAVALTSLAAGTAKLGKLKDKDYVVTNAWQAMSYHVEPNSEWAKEQFDSQAFRDGITNALHKKIAMFIIPVNAAVFKEPAYQPNVAYEVGDKITHEWVIYKCKTAVTKASNTDWDAVKTKFDFYEHPVIYKGFELKGTICNFDPSENGTTFYSQSELAEGGTDPKRGIRIDAMRLYVQSCHLGSDGRRYTKISNTITDWDATNTLVNVTVLVDTSCLIRTPEDENPEWLYENNENLFWTYTRTKNGGHEEEILNPGGGYRALWRPIMPVRWFKEFPDWAR